MLCLTPQAHRRDRDSTRCPSFRPLQVCARLRPSFPSFLINGSFLANLNNRNATSSGIFRQFAPAARKLCDGRPSHVTVLSRLELVEAFEEVWRMFSWSEHLTLELPPLHEAPCVSGGALVLPIYEARRGEATYFVVQSIPSPPHGTPERHWRIGFDFVVLCFVIDATQDLSAVGPRHDITALVHSFCLLCAYTHRLIMQRTCARAVNWSALDQWGSPSFGNFPIHFNGK